jgi:hypothetical protein
LDLVKEMGANKLLADLLREKRIRQEYAGKKMHRIIGAFYSLSAVYLGGNQWPNE